MVREDRRCTIMPKRRLHDLAGVNRGLRERPGEHALRGDDAVLRIEPQAPELLTLASTEREPEVVPDRAGGGDASGGLAVTAHAPPQDIPRLPEGVFLGLFLIGGAEASWEAAGI